MAKDKHISESALAVLSECTQELTEVGLNGPRAVVKITGGQLDRKLYEEVNAVLAAIGGKWARKTGGHVFTEPANEVAEMLEGCIETGIAVPLRPGSYFPTPPELAARMVAMADIRDEMRVLEPSAGSGAIAEAILSKHNGCFLYLIEQDAKLVAILSQKFMASELMRATELHCLNFLEHTVSCGPLEYHRIVMNPPFAYLADVDHVTHAYSLLASGGKLVSVMSAGVTFRREAKAVAFRELLERHGSLERLPEGTFKTSNTMVNTVLVTLEK